MSIPSYQGNEIFIRSLSTQISEILQHPSLATDKKVQELLQTSGLTKEQQKQVYSDIKAIGIYPEETEIRQIFSNLFEQTQSIEEEIHGLDDEVDGTYTITFKDEGLYEMGRDELIHLGILKAAQENDPSAKEFCLPFSKEEFDAYRVCAEQFKETRTLPKDFEKLKDLIKVGHYLDDDDLANYIANVIAIMPTAGVWQIDSYISLLETVFTVPMMPATKETLQSYLDKVFTDPPFEDPTARKNIRHFLARCPASLPITLSLIDPSDETLRLAAKELGRMQRLENLSVDITNGKNLTDEGLASLDDLIQLKGLSLFQCPHITNSAFSRLSSCISLEKLDFESCQGLSGRLLEHLPAPQRLKSLSFKGCRPFIDRDIDCISHLDRLENLELSYCHLSNTEIAHFRSLTTLKYLDLSGNHITNEALQYLSGMKELTYLNLRETHVTNDGIPHLQAFEHLKSLVIPSVDASLSDAVPHLERLWVVKVDDAALAELSSHLPELRYLSIRSFRGINPASFTNFNQLEFLEMMPVSDSSFAPLSSLDNLKCLIIHNCILDSDRLVDISRIKSLEKLIITGIYFNFPSLSQCLDQLPNLKECYLDGSEETLKANFPHQRQDLIIPDRLNYKYRTTYSRETMENPFQ